MCKDRNLEHDPSWSLWSISISAFWRIRCKVFNAMPPSVAEVDYTTCKDVPLTCSDCVPEDGWPGWEARGSWVCHEFRHSKFRPPWWIPRKAFLMWCHEWFSPVTKLFRLKLGNDNDIEHLYEHLDICRPSTPTVCVSFVHVHQKDGQHWQHAASTWIYRDISTYTCMYSSIDTPFYTYKSKRRRL